MSAIKQYLNQHHDQFSNLTFDQGPADKFHLEGEVKTSEDLKTLQAELTRLFGEDRAKYILNVTVVDRFE